MENTFNWTQGLMCWPWRQPHLSLQDCRSSLGHLDSVDLEEVVRKHECETVTGISTQEEADTGMIHHSVEVASNGMNVHYPQDTNVFGFEEHHFLATVLQQPKEEANVFLQPIIIMTHLTRRNQKLWLIPPSHRRRGATRVFGKNRHHRSDTASSFS